MRVFVAGASGALGSRLVPQLIAAGHDVIGTHKSPASAELIRMLGAAPVMVDLLDASAVRKAVLENEPDAIVHEATALGNAKWGRNFDKTFAGTNELRTRGTDALLAAAREARVRRFVAQSFASYRTAREGGPVKTEDDPLDPTPPGNAVRSFAAMAYLERVVTDFGGIVLRYGLFYGAANDGLIEPVRKRQYPIVGGGGGITSWIHLDDAAEATVLALEHEGPAVYNIVDDEPAAVREWLPVLAQALAAKPPRRFPVWLARVAAGEAAVVMGTEARGASNAKARRELDWTPRHPSWRTGFRATYSAISVADRPQPQPVASKGRPMSDLQTVADRFEIEALRGEFTDAVMMRDYDRLASLFTDDGVVRIPHINAEAVNREQIRAGIERLQGLCDLFVQTTHPGTIRLEGDTAAGRAYVSELIRMRDGTSELNYALYHDRYRRTSDGWKFTERVYEIRYLDRAPMPTDRLVSADNHGGSSTDSRPDRASRLA